MREILFRGKCKETGKWYEGQYINLHKTTYCFKEDYETDKDNDIHQIVFEQMTDWGLPNRHLRVDIIPETVGQYTGLTDKNGKKIFEGDIVQSIELELKGIIIFDEHCRFMIKDFSTGSTYLISYNNDEIQVIGNIHDNPELLESEVNNNV